MTKKTTSEKSAENKTTKKTATEKHELLLSPEMEEELSNGRGDDEDEEGG